MQNLRSLTSLKHYHIFKENYQTYKLNTYGLGTYASTYADTITYCIQGDRDSILDFEMFEISVIPQRVGQRSKTGYNCPFHVILKSSFGIILPSDAL